MFVGHYGPAAGLAGGRIKLWHGVVAVQLLDILWAPFVLVGIEKLRIIPNFTAANHLDLYHMPWTHSLPMAVFWSVVAGFAYRLIQNRAGAVGGVVIAALVFSHWLTDLIMHKPDLLVWFGGDKIGYGLWDNRILSFTLEVSLFIGGLIIFAIKVPARGSFGMVAFTTFLVVGVILQVVGNFGPPPSSPQMAAFSALVCYIVFILLAMWIDATRQRSGVSSSD